MVTEELLTYIKRQKSNGVPDDAIREILRANGWQAADVEKAFTTIAQSAAQASPVVKASDLMQKVNSFKPQTQATPSSFGQMAQNTQPFGTANTSKEELIRQFQSPIQQVQPLAKPLSPDTYREPVINEKPMPTTADFGTSLGNSLPDDIKDRLKKISTASDFSPYKKELPQNIETATSASMQPSAETPASMSLMERLAKESAQERKELAALEGDSAVKPQPIMSMPAGPATPYSPSIDKYQMVPEHTKPHRGGLKRAVAFLLILGLLGGAGYFLYTTKPDIAKRVYDIVIGSREVAETPSESAEVQEEVEQVEPTEEDVAIPPATTVAIDRMAIESAFKVVNLKVHAYMTEKKTMEGVCSNISKGIARDVIDMRQKYGGVSCVDSASSFSFSVPLGEEGFMCTDATKEVVLVQSAPTVPQCQ